MKIKIDKEKCIGCGNCAAICPEVFSLKEGKAQVNQGTNFESHRDCIKQAINSCPVLAIQQESDEQDQPLPTAPEASQ